MHQARPGDSQYDLFGVQVSPRGFALKGAAVFDFPERQFCPVASEAVGLVVAKLVEPMHYAWGHGQGNEGVGVGLMIAWAVTWAFVGFSIVENKNVDHGQDYCIWFTVNEMPAFNARSRCRCRSQKAFSRVRPAPPIVMCTDIVLAILASFFVINTCCMFCSGEIIPSACVRYVT